MGEQIGYRMITLEGHSTAQGSGVWVTVTALPAAAAPGASQAGRKVAMLGPDGCGFLVPLAKKNRFILLEALQFAVRDQPDCGQRVAI